MSTNKLLQSLSEDPQLEKQIGCMAGILQLFDRHQVLTGRRLYGHKRIAAAASKTQPPPASNCGSPGCESGGIMSDNVLLNHSEEQRPKHGSSAGLVASIDQQQRSQPPQTPTTPTDAKSSMSFARTPSSSTNEAYAEANNRDQLPKISFDIARSSVLAPRRLDSSRSLHEVRVNAAHEGKVFARKSVDTAERAAAAARGALKELSRISSDFTRPSHDEDQVSIRDVVRSSLGQEEPVPRSTSNSLLSNSAYPPRMSSEAHVCTQKVSLAKDRARSHNVETSISVLQAGERSEAFRPTRHNYKPTVEMETPSKTCADISESLRLLAKLRESAPTYSTLLGNEGIEYVNESSNSTSTYYGPQQARSSVDLAREGPGLYPSRASLPRIPGRTSSYEPSRASFVDSLFQGAPRVREVPRLSLDGRGAGCRIKADPQGKPASRTLLNSRSVSCSNSECDAESLHEKRTSFSTNVVAKLMGLDEMPSDDLLQPHSKVILSSSSDQKVAMRAPNTVMHDVDPTFSQCGKYVSASFFPSKRRDDIKISIDLEEEEEDSYLQSEPLSWQEAQTTNMRVGSLKGYTADRSVTTENVNHLGPLCYQPKNHHLMEDRPPHVLSPAARICAQIEEMQRADSFHKEFDRGSRMIGVQHSSKPELDALNQVLGATHVKNDYAGSHLEKLPLHRTHRRPQPEGGRTAFLHEAHQQAEQSLAVTWKTKRVVSDEFEIQIHDHHSNISRNSLESHSRKGRNGIHEEALHPSSRQFTVSENYNQGARIRTDAHISPSSSNSSLYNTPRKGILSNEYMSPGGANNGHPAHVPGGRRVSVCPHTQPHGTSARFSTPPRTPVSQQLRSSNNGSYSWEVSSVSSTASSNARDQCAIGNVGYRVANKQRRQSEKGMEKKKAGILKDKEESKANLVSLRPSPAKPTEKKAKSAGITVTSRSNSRTLQRPMRAEKSDNLRTGTRSQTRSSAKKAVEVKRKLSFSSRTQSSGARPSDVCDEEQEPEFVDKAIVSSIESKPIGGGPQCELGKVTHEEMQQDPCISAGSRENDLDSSVSTPPSINYARTEGEAENPALPLAGVSAEVSRMDCHNGEIESSIFDMDAGDGSSPMCTPTGALRLPAVLQQENEDAESQGDKSTGSCEQPSPISVLEGPFYEDDIASPPTTTKFVLKLDELEEEGRGEVDAGNSPQGSFPLLKQVGNGQNSSLTDLEYVKHLLQHSCQPTEGYSEDISDATGVWKLGLLDSHHLLQMEEELVCNHVNEAASKSKLGSSVWRRKMLFDIVNAGLVRRLQAWRLFQQQPWILACESGFHGTVAGSCSGALRQCIVGLDEENNLCLSREGVRILLEEVWDEIEGKTPKPRGMSSKVGNRQGIVGSMETSAYEGEEEDGGACDDVGHMLEEDILAWSQCSGSLDAWQSLLSEKGELGLDLERLIFKDLIDHTIRDLGFPFHSSLSTTKRQLFKLHN